MEPTRMKNVVMAACAAILLCGATATFAAPPPANAKPLSEIVSMVERQAGVAYIDEIDWDDDGYWEIEYVTTDGAERRIKVDPVSGQTRR